MNEYLNDLKAGGRVMKAKEMFEKLGYKRKRTKDITIKYIDIEDKYLTITFYCKDKEFIKSDCNLAKIINNEEFKAIQKQIEELGW